MTDWREPIPKLLRAHLERVHDLSGVGYVCPTICEIAANEIERLRAEVAAARTAALEEAERAIDAEAETEATQVRAVMDEPSRRRLAEWMTGLTVAKLAIRALKEKP